MNRTVAMIVSRGWLSVCSFATFVVIGQTLSPHAFGVFALASSLALLPHAFIGAGFYERVLSRKGAEADDDTAYWCTAGVSVLALIAICAMALVMGYGFRAWDVAALLAPLGLASLLSGFAITREAELLRDGAGARVAAVLISAETIGLATLIGALWLGGHVESLVYGRIANQATLLAGYTIATGKYFPRRFDGETAKETGRFSLGMVFARFVGWADGYGGDMLLAAVLSNAGLGLYRMGGRLYMAGASVLLQAPAAAALTYVSKAHAVGDQRMSGVVLRTVRLHAALALPLFAGLAATASEITPMVLGPDWSGVALITTLYCLLAPSVIFSNAYAAVLVARGHTRLYSLIGAGNAAIGIAAIFIGAQYGAAGAAAAKSIAVFAFTFSALMLLSAFTPEHRGRAALSMAAHCASALTLWAATSALLPLLGTDPHPMARIARVLAAGSAGVIVYVFALRLLAPTTFKLTWRVLMRTLRRRRAAPDQEPLGASAGPPPNAR